MKHEGKTIEPRDIVKANAEIYRYNELIRIEKEDYNRWLAVHNDEVTKKNITLQEKSQVDISKEKQDQQRAKL